MKHIGVTVRHVAITLAMLVACSVPPVTFTGQEDAGPDATPDTPDVVALQVSTNAVTVSEADTATFTVRLTAPPASTVLVSIDSADDNRVGVAPTSVQFDSTNWNTPRTVTLSGREDADTEDEAVNVVLSSSVGNETVAVTVTDNDSLRIVVAPSGSLDVGEGANANIAVRLSAQPSGPVTVMVASTDGAVAGVSPSTLTFGTGTWDVDQNIVVSGQQDADVLNGNAMIMFTATGLTSATVSVQIIDDDVLGILPSTTSLGTLVEGGTTTFTVRLTQQPQSDVVVAVSTSDSMILTATPTPLTFTNSTWMTPQTVTVNLPEDIDTADETATISLTASTLTTRTVSVSVDDNDTQTVVASPDPVPVDEGGSRVLSVRLQFQPSADITLSVTSLNTGVAMVSTGSLTFTPGNYDQNQLVTVNAPEDADAVPNMTSIRFESLPDALSRDVPVNVTDNDQLLIDPSTTMLTIAENGSAMFGVRLTAMPGATVTVSVASSDPTVASVSPSMLMFTTTNYGTMQMVTVSGVADQDLTAEMPDVTLSAAGLQPRVVDVTVNDDDTQRVLVTNLTPSVNEGATATVGVSLEFIPTAATTVTLASMDMSVATVSPTTRTFMPGDYATPQNITITGVSDPDAADESTSINATAPGATAAVITVNVNDDEALGIETSVTTATVGESSTQMFGVRLTAQPTADTTVTIVSTDTMAATVSPATLTFTTSDWGTFKQVTITGVGDLDAVDDNIDVNLTSPPLSMRSVDVTVQDDDTQDILLSPASLTVSESGSNTFGVRLAAMPTSDIVVSVASSNTNEATASPSMLTFTPLDYGTNKTVTVNGVADFDLTNDGVNINLSSAGLPTRSVSATVTDDDTQTILASSAGPLNLTEGGATQQVSFQLQFIPTGTVTVTVTPPAGVGANPTSLSFGPGTYSTPQPVTVSGLEDADAADIALAPLSAAAPGATSATVSINVDDNDVLGLSVPTGSITVTEGSTGSFQVQLTAQPASNVVVMVQSSDTAVASVNPIQAMLTFTPSNWNQPQSPQIIGTQDVDVQSEGANIMLTSSVGSANVGVTVVDDDVITIQTTPASVSVTEGSTASFTVTLSNMPSSNVVVNLASADATVLSIVNAPPALTFTPANYGTPQTVTVMASNDANFADASVDVNLTATGIATKTVPATVLDDDLTLTDLSVQMGPASGGGTATATGDGFTGAVTGTMTGNAVTGWTAVSGTSGSFTIPAKSGTNPNWSDLRLVKGANSVTIPRAHYYGQWAAPSGISGGTVYALKTSGATNVYAGTFDGVYVSTNNGTSYARASTGLPNLEWIRDLAVHPTNADIAYVPTRTGVYVTTNRGTSWTRAGTLAVQTRCVAVNPATPTTIYTCTGTEVQRSTDSGNTWTVVRSGLSTPVMISFTNDGTVGWLATWNGIYRSTDSGATWNPANGQLSATSLAAAIVAHPMQGSTAYVAVNATLYKTTDGGVNWTNPYSGPYVSGFAINPSSPATIYASSNTTVIKSVDSGVSWQTQVSGIPSWAQNFQNSIALRSSTPAEVHVGGSTGIYKSTNSAQSWSKSDVGIDTYHVSQIAPHPTTAGTVIAGTQSGAFRSTDFGATWTQAMTGVTGGSASVNSVVYAPSQPATVYMSIQAGSAWKSTDGGVNWTSCGLTSPGVLAVDPTNPSIVYATRYPDRVMKSTDGCTSFTAMNNGIPVNNDILDLQIVGTTILAADYADGIYRSTDGGASWSLSNTGFPAGGAHEFQADASGTVYAVSNSPNRAYRSTDAGVTWTQASTFGATLAMDPTRAQTGYLVSGTTVYRTLNSFGTTRTFSLGPLPTTSCCVYSTIAVDSGGAAVYYGPPQRGLYRIAP